jgi:hypothetical protein
MAVSIVVTLMIFTAVWMVLGAVLHGGSDLPRDFGREAWWWESSARSTSYDSLPSSHPLVAWRQGPGGPGGQA